MRLVEIGTAANANEEFINQMGERLLKDNIDCSVIMTDPHSGSLVGEERVLIDTQHPELEVAKAS